eukprot:SAG31_NODE_396_length_16264_cov_17.206496_9_plen_230_part_00
MDADFPIIFNTYYGVACCVQFGTAPQVRLLAQGTSYRIARQCISRFSNPLHAATAPPQPPRPRLPSRRSPRPPRTSIATSTLPGAAASCSLALQVVESRASELSAADCRPCRRSVELALADFGLDDDAAQPRAQPPSRCCRLAIAMLLKDPNLNALRTFVRYHRCSHAARPRMRLIGINWDQLGHILAPLWMVSARTVNSAALHVADRLLCSVQAHRFSAFRVFPGRHA